MVFQNSINLPPAKLAKSWTSLFDLEVDEKAGVLGMIVTVPALLVANLANNGEFYDMVCLCERVVGISQPSLNMPCTAA